MQLNLVRSINLILDTLAHELAAHPPGRPRAAPATPPDSDEEAEPGPPLALTEKHALLRLRLAPLRQVENDLRRLLGAASSEAGAADGGGMRATPFDEPYLSGGGGGYGAGFGPGVGEGAGEGAASVRSRRSADRDLCLRSNRSWKDALHARRTSVASSAKPGSRAVSPGPGLGGPGAAGERDDATEVIAGCREDVRALWEDGVVQEMLARQRIRLADSAGL